MKIWQTQYGWSMAVAVMSVALVSVKYLLLPISVTKLGLLSCS